MATMVSTQLVVLTALAVGEPLGARPCALVLLRRNDCFILKAPQIQSSPLLFVQSLFFDIYRWGGCRSCNASAYRAPLCTRTLYCPRAALAT